MNSCSGQRRSKRLKALASNKKYTATNNPSISFGLGSQRGRNHKGLPTLPDELLLEILSYFPSFTTPKRNYDPYASDLLAHNTRREILHALCLTCGNLRRFFLPFLWEYIESYEGLKFEGDVIKQPDHPSQEKVCAKELIRQLEMVTVRMPSLAKYVRVIDTVIVKYSEATVLAELARCMTLLPNLKTIKFVEPMHSRYAGYLTGGERPAWRKAFRGTSYPQVQNAILAEPFYSIITAFPELRSLQAMEDIETRPSCLDFVQTPAALEHFFFPAFCHKLDANEFSGIRRLDISSVWFRLSRLNISNLKQLDRVILDISCDSQPQPVCDDIFAHLLELRKEDSRDKILILKSVEGDCTAFAVLAASSDKSKAIKLPAEISELGGT